MILIPSFLRPGIMRSGIIPDGIRSPGGVQFRPDTISGLQLWLDPSTLTLANGASVTSLADLSGNSRTATAVSTAPTFEASGPNGQKWIVADSRSLRTPAFNQWPSKRGTWFFVYQPSAEITTWRRVLGTNTGGTGNTWVWGAGASNIDGYALFYTAFPTPAQRFMWDKQNDPVIVCLRRDSDTNITVFRNASKTVAFAISNVDTAANGLRIGESLTGRVGEVFGYDSALSDAQCYAALEYLSKKWASPKKPVNVIFEGDSQTFGVGLGSNTFSRAVEDNTYPHKTILELGSPRNVSYHNVAVGGSRWQELEARATTLDGRLNPKADNVLIVWCGTNEAYLNNASATYAAQVTYCNARRAAGWNKIIVGTAMDRVDQSNEVWRSALNTLIRNGYAGHADGLLDVGGHAILGAAGAYNNATYFNADKVHLNAAGWQVLAETAADVLAPLIDI